MGVESNSRGEAVCSDCKKYPSECECSRRVGVRPAAKGMRWEAAIQQAIEDLSAMKPQYRKAYTALVLRAAELTTDTSACDKCGGG